MPLTNLSASYRQSVLDFSQAFNAFFSKSVRSSLSLLRGAVTLMRFSLQGVALHLDHPPLPATAALVFFSSRLAPFGRDFSGLFSKLRVFVYATDTRPVAPVNTRPTVLESFQLPEP